MNKIELSGIGLRNIDCGSRIDRVNNPMFINDIDISKSEDNEKLQRFLFTRYDEDTLSSVPSCRFGCTEGRHLVGRLCNECGSEVRERSDIPIESILWMRCPRGIERFITTAAYRHLSSLLTMTHFKPMVYFLDPNYKEKEHTRYIERFKGLFPNEFRGLTNFYKHFDYIMETCINNPTMFINTSNLKVKLPKYLSLHRHALFTEYLPVPSNMLVVVEKSVTGMSNNPTYYCDTEVNKPLIDAVRRMASIVTMENKLTDKQIESRTAKVLFDMEMFYSRFYNKNIKGKKGHMRKNVGGSRLDHTARAVIVPVSKPHKHNRLVMPYGIMVTLLSTHLASKFLRKGYSPNKIKEKIYKGTRTFDQEIYDTMMELMNESRDQVFYGLFQRNPSLDRLSTKLLETAEIRKDPKINAIGLSPLIIATYGADFDGDQMNYTMMTDEYTTDAFKVLEPFTGVFSDNHPNKISDAIALPKIMTPSLGNWLRN